MSSIHFNESYLNFQYSFNGFPTILVIIPWFYMIPTFFVILKIFKVYISTDWDIIEPGKNQHVFLVILLSQFFCFFYFIMNFLLIRLPATGILTSFCAGIPPSQGLLLIPFLTYYVNYLAMIFPFFLPVVRLVILIFPKGFMKINSTILKIVIPLALIYPICFTFFLIPAIGICKQLEFPYPFGSIWIYYSGPAFGLRNTPFFIGNAIFWLTMSILANFLLFLKLSRAREHLITQQLSSVSHQAQVSITKTTVAMIAFYVTNGVTLIHYYYCYESISFMAYGAWLRPFGNDAQVLFVSWIFYKTHPVFKKIVEENNRINSVSVFERRNVSHHSN